MTPLFMRVLQHLLPRSNVWSLTQNKTIGKFFGGLAAFFDDSIDSPKAYADSILSEVFPATTSLASLAIWETQYGLTHDALEANRRSSLAAEWAATGGQSKAYIQSVLQTAGFALYVHDWWSSGPPYVSRNPRSYTQVPQIGTYQCAAYALTGHAECAPPLLGQAQCNDFLANEPGYLVNKDLTLRPPPAVPSDPSAWPSFFYVGAATFPNRVSIPVARRAELERLVLKLRPTHQWVVMLVDYV
jgi:hypothetical protein